MGFGSYDESEQQDQNVEAESDYEAVNVYENDYEGDVDFETHKSTDELLDQLETIKRSE